MGESDLHQSANLRREYLMQAVNKTAQENMPGRNAIHRCVGKPVEAGQGGRPREAARALTSLPAGR